jgi:putative pyruvate formate lyase activating enzyme
MRCTLCPRECNIDRKTDTGYCKMGENIKISKIMLHKWEEPCISGTGDENQITGSGAIFFAGCSLRCVYCQNMDISQMNKGYEISAEELASEMLELQKQGAYNINLVTPTHFSDKIRKALDIAKPRLKLPVIYNTSGYEKEAEIRKMAGYVDVFLTDIKYFSPEYSKKYSGASDYYARSKEALGAMLSLAQSTVFDENGIITSGVIVRHLVLPNLRKDSINILEDLKNSFDISKFKLSLMAQYTPDFCKDEFSELKRKITTFEYESVVNRAVDLGYDGYIQDKSASSVKYTPKF